MNNTYDDYGTKLENIIRNIKINNKKYKKNNNIKVNICEKKFEINKNNNTINENNIINENKINNENKSDKDFYCKQLDSLNYCLEMHKVRKNKKADFDIYSTLKYNIEDENIGKDIVFYNWKDLDDNVRNELIDDFINEISENNNLDLEYTKIFINNNLNKIKYDKYTKKIVDIHGMIVCTVNNETILKIKIKDKKNTNINKLRKSLTNLKKK